MVKTKALEMLCHNISSKASLLKIKMKELEVHINLTTRGEPIAIISATSGNEFYQAHTPTPDCKKLASKVTESKFKTKVEEKVQNNNVELESFTDVDIEERTEPEVTVSKFKIEVEKKVSNVNVKLKSFNDVDIDERTEPEVTESKFKTEVEENSPLTNCQVFLLIIWLR